MAEMTPAEKLAQAKWHIGTSQILWGFAAGLLISNAAAGSIALTILMACVGAWQMTRWSHWRKIRHELEKPK